MAQRMVYQFQRSIRSHLSDVKTTIAQIVAYNARHNSDDPLKFSPAEIISLTTVYDMMVAKLALKVAKN